MSGRGWTVAHLDELERRGPFERAWHVPIRSSLDIGAFGIGAYVVEEADERVIEEHDETGALAGGHEELYLVLRGHAAFTVEGEEVDAPAGTLVFVRDVAAHRTAVSREPGTTVLAVGGVPGRAYEVAPWESAASFWPLYVAGDYDGAIGELRRALEEYPDNAGMLFNLACCESLAGRADEALGYLRRAIEQDERLRDSARSEEDLEALHDDPRFGELVGA